MTKTVDLKPPSVIVTASTPEMPSPSSLPLLSAPSPAEPVSPVSSASPVSPIRTRAASLSRPPSLVQLAEAMRLRLQVASLQRPAPVDPPLAAAPAATSAALQRRASASDIALALAVNRARLPSLAAIQERISRNKADSLPEPPPPASPPRALPVLSSLVPAAAPTPAPPAVPVPVVAPAPAPAGVPAFAAAPASAPAPDAPPPPLPAPDAVHPLQHIWTLFFDSKATLASARRTASQLSDASPPEPAGSALASTLGAGGQAYQAALQTIGSFKTVEHFCRYFNWTVRPSMMEMGSSVQLFKDAIKPMWEDPANANGGKWTLTMKHANPQLLDKLWTYLVLGLVGEQVDVNDDVCGAIVATRPRGNRVQIWVREKNNVERVNGLGRRLITLLEIHDEPGISFEFSPHSGSNLGSSKFIAIYPTNTNSNSSSPQRPAIGSPLASYSSSPTQQPRVAPPLIRSSTDMRRTSSLEHQLAQPRLVRPPLLAHHTVQGPSALPLQRSMMLNNQLNGADVPIQNGIWRPSGPPPPPIQTIASGGPRTLTGPPPGLARGMGGLGAGPARPHSLGQLPPQKPLLHQHTSNALMASMMSLGNYTKSGLGGGNSSTNTIGSGFSAVGSTCSNPQQQRQLTSSPAPSH